MGINNRNMITILFKNYKNYDDIYLFIIFILEYTLHASGFYQLASYLYTWVLKEATTFSERVQKFPR
jgi:hypothetical protein